MTIANSANLRWKLQFLGKAERNFKKEVCHRLGSLVELTAVSHCLSKVLPHDYTSELHQENGLVQ